MSVEKAEALFFGPKEYKVTDTRLAMGIFVAMTAIHPSRDEAEQAIGLAFKEIDRHRSDCHGCRRFGNQCFLMEPVAGVQFINSQPDCECFVIGKDGDLSHSKGWQV